MVVKSRPQAKPIPRAQYPPLHLPQFNHNTPEMKCASSIQRHWSRETLFRAIISCVSLSSVVVQGTSDSVKIPPTSPTYCHRDSCIQHRTHRGRFWSSSCLTSSPILLQFRLQRLICSSSRISWWVTYPVRHLVSVRYRFSHFVSLCFSFHCRFPPSSNVSSAYTDVSLPTSFLHLLVACPIFVLISFFYAESIVAQSRVSQLSSHYCSNTAWIENLLKWLAVTEPFWRDSELEDRGDEGHEHACAFNLYVLFTDPNLWLSASLILQIISNFNRQLVYSSTLRTALLDSRHHWCQLE